MQQSNVNMTQTADLIPPARMDSKSAAPKGDHAFKKAIEKAAAGRETQGPEQPKQTEPGARTNGGERPERTNADGKPDAVQGQTDQTRNGERGSPGAENPRAALEDAQIGLMIALLTDANTRVVSFAPTEQPVAWQGGQGEAQANAAAEGTGEAVKGSAPAAGEPAGQAAPTPGQSAGQQSQSAGQQVQPRAEQPRQAQPQAEEPRQTQQQAEQPRGARSGASGNAAGSQATEQPTARNAQETARPVARETAMPAEPKEVKPEQPTLLKPETGLNPDKVNVKVGDGGALKSEQFSSVLSEKIIAKAAEGRQQFEIQLMPRDLGKIIIKMMIQGGKTEIIMQCLNPKTHQLVLANAETIRNIVETNTGTQTTLTAEEEEETPAYNAFDENEDGDKRDDREDGPSREREEREAETFLHQLRLGLVGDEDALVA